MRLMRHVLLLLLVAGYVYPQTDSTWYLNKPIERIEFTGLETIKENELSAIVEPFIGR